MKIFPGFSVDEETGFGLFFESLVERAIGQITVQPYLFAEFFVGAQVEPEPLTFPGVAADPAEPGTDLDLTDILVPGGKEPECVVEFLVLWRVQERVYHFVNAYFRSAKGFYTGGVPVVVRFVPGIGEYQHFFKDPVLSEFPGHGGITDLNLVIIGRFTGDKANDLVSDGVKIDYKFVLAEEPGAVVDQFKFLHDTQFVHVVHVGFLVNMHNDLLYGISAVVHPAIAGESVLAFSFGNKNKMQQSPACDHLRIGETVIIEGVAIIVDRAYKLFIKNRYEVAVDIHVLIKCAKVFGQAFIFYAGYLRSPDDLSRLSGIPLVIVVGQGFGKKSRQDGFFF